MAGIPLYLAGAIEPGVIPHVVTATAGFLMVHYTTEDPFSAGPGPDPWHPRSDEFYAPQAPAPAFQMDFAHDVDHAYVSLRTGSVSDEFYLSFYTFGNELSIYSAENIGFLSALGTTSVPFTPPASGNMHLIFQGGDLTLIDDAEVVLAEIPAATIEGLFAFATAPTPYSHLNTYPYAFSCWKGVGGSVGDSGTDGMVNVYYDGTAIATPDFWTNFILSYEEP